MGKALRNAVRIDEEHDWETFQSIHSDKISVKKNCNGNIIRIYISSKCESYTIITTRDEVLYAEFTTYSGEHANFSSPNINPPYYW